MVKSDAESLVRSSEGLEIGKKPLLNGRSILHHVTNENAVPSATPRNQARHNRVTRGRGLPVAAPRTETSPASVYCPITFNNAWRFSLRTALRALSRAAGTSAGSSTRSP